MAPTQAQSTLKPEALLAQISNLESVLADHAAQAEQDRKPVDEVMAAIEATGVYRFFVPKRYGGYEFALDQFLQVGITLGKGCISTAWATTFCVEHNWLLAQFGQACQDEIFGQQPYIIAPGTLAPKGSATPAEGGYVVDGVWQWGTGIMHADWVLVGALTLNQDTQQPDLLMCLIPKDEVCVLDTWYTSGMAGTGSNDIQVDKVFVPSHRVQSLSEVSAQKAPGVALHNSPTFRMPMAPLHSLTAAAPAVGGLKRAVELFRQRLQERTVYASLEKQGERAVSQARLGHAAAATANAEQLLFSIAREVSAWGERDTPCPVEERARLRLQIAHVVDLVKKTIQDVIAGSGAGAHMSDSPLQRIQRDINMLSCHTVFDLDIGGEQCGRTMIGLAPNVPV